MRHVEKSWVLQNCRSRHDFKKRYIKGLITQRSVRHKEGRLAELSVEVEFNGTSGKSSPSAGMGWHYYWNSGRYKNAKKHSMRCYVMLEIDIAGQVVGGPSIGNDLKYSWLNLVHTVKSPPFSIGVSQVPPDQASLPSGRVGGHTIVNVIQQHQKILQQQLLRLSSRRGQPEPCKIQQPHLLQQQVIDDKSLHLSFQPPTSFVLLITHLFLNW